MIHCETSIHMDETGSDLINARECRHSTVFTPAFNRYKVPREVPTIGFDPCYCGVPVQYSGTFTILFRIWIAAQTVEDSSKYSLNIYYDMDSGKVCCNI